MEKAFIKTGIFGGTFNPVHIGHLALANYLCEYEDLDEVWFLVTPQNPFKKDVRLLDDRIRLEMVEAATRGYPRFRRYTSETFRNLSRTGVYVNHRGG